MNFTFPRVLNFLVGCWLGVGLGWVGLGWVELSWVGLVRKNSGEEGKKKKKAGKRSTVLSVAEVTD